MAAEPQLPFEDRETAAALLADRLAARGLSPATVVLGIPRGGVPVAAVIARRLHLPLDLVVAHKIPAPDNPEFALGAATADGTIIVEPWAREAADLGDEELARLAELEVRQAWERERRLRRGCPAISLAGRPVVVVDDGIATGATVHAAVVAVRRAGGGPVIVASPVAAADTVDRLAHVADDVVVLATPEPFWAVGLWYRRFEQVGDEDVARLLEEGRGGREPLSGG